MEVQVEVEAEAEAEAETEPQSKAVGSRFWLTFAFSLLT